MGSLHPSQLTSIQQTCLRKRLLRSSNAVSDDRLCHRSTVVGSGIYDRGGAGCMSDHNECWKNLACGMRQLALGTTLGETDRRPTWLYTESVAQIGPLRKGLIPNYRRYRSASSLAPKTPESLTFCCAIYFA